jgi:predicted TIM-barrel fold metal-dependent hydrolase
MQVVDPHIHLWNLDKGRYPWLAAPSRSFMGDYAALAKTYEVHEFLGEAAGIEVLKVVHIDAGHDPTDPLAETRWLQSLADSPGNRGMPHGIVAYADLSAPDVADLLAAHAGYRNVRGIRQILNVHSDPLYDYVGRHFMREAAWQAGFAQLRRHGLSFDLQLYPAQMNEAAALARAHTDTAIILNHTGMFVDRTTVTGWRQWREGMRTLAGCPNISAKISGLGMLDHDWTIESFRPLVLETIDALGVERCMFASNFPVDRLYSSYATLWHAFAAIVEGASDADKDALFRNNAQRIYRI